MMTATAPKSSPKLLLQQYLGDLNHTPKNELPNAVNVYVGRGQGRGVDKGGPVGEQTAEEEERGGVGGG